MCPPPPPLNHHLSTTTSRPPPLDHQPPPPTTNHTFAASTDHQRVIATRWWVFFLGFGRISATGTKNLSILLLFFVNMMYYRYEMRVQTFEGLRAIAVKLW